MWNNKYFNLLNAGAAKWDNKTGHVPLSVIGTTTKELKAWTKKSVDHLQDACTEKQKKRRQNKTKKKIKSSTVFI